MPWEVIYYESPDGDCPVRDFLDDLPKAHRAKVFAAIALLQDRGPALGFPYTSQVEGRIRELRTHYGRQLYRILYCMDHQRRVVLLEAFEKSTAKVPHPSDWPSRRVACKAISNERSNLMERKKRNRFENHLAEQLRDPEFRLLYEKEREALRIGMEVARRRRALGLTQARLAREVGTSEAAISRLESGDANATVRTLRRVAAALRADWRHHLVPTTSEPTRVRAARR